MILRSFTILFFLFLGSANGAASETPLQAQTRAFLDLYNDNELGGRYDPFGGCKGNAITFVLEDLIEKKVPFEHGYVVHFSAIAYIHYFQSASSNGKNFYGNKTVWSNRTPFYLANYYFHIFLVLDGRVFDFSIRDGKIQPIARYLRKSFLPPVGQFVEDCFLQPHFDEKSLIGELSSPQNEMFIYRLDSISKTRYPQDLNPKYHLGEPSYRGRPIDLFIVNGVVAPSELPTPQRNAAVKRSETLGALIESGEFDRRPYLVGEIRCLQLLGNAGKRR